MAKITHPRVSSKYGFRRGDVVVISNASHISGSITNIINSNCDCDIIEIDDQYLVDENNVQLKQNTGSNKPNFGISVFIKGKELEIVYEYPNRSFKWKYHIHKMSDQLIHGIKDALSRNLESVLYKAVNLGWISKNDSRRG